MSKANSVYVLMLAIFAAGLWAILSLGSIFLHAAPDLAGKWELRAADANPQTPPAHAMAILQSGRFLQVNLDGKDYPLKLVNQQIAQATTGMDELHLELAGRDLQMTFQGRADADLYHLQTRGPLAGDWNALRIARTYPKKLADQPASRPASGHAH